MGRHVHLHPEQVCGNRRLVQGAGFRRARRCHDGNGVRAVGHAVATRERRHLDAECRYRPAEHPARGQRADDLQRRHRPVEGHRDGRPRRHLHLQPDQPRPHHDPARFVHDHRHRGGHGQDSDDRDGQRHSGGAQRRAGGRSGDGHVVVTVDRSDPEPNGHRHHGATDADGDPLTFTAGTIETTNGGEIVLAADGSFTYTISKLLTSSYYHEAAKIGASGSAVRDTFTVTVSDTFGASTSFVASVPIYATNTPPNTPTSGVFWGLGANDWTSVFATDPNGDSLTYTITKQPEHGSASYSSGSQILSTTGAQSGDTIILTVTDGYYVVVDGVVTGTPASSSRTYTV
nr:Ig-like domain-containing protein [Mycolicibacterium vanbaalenii]